MFARKRLDPIHEWLVKAVYKKPQSYALQYGYLLSLRGQRVIATASGFNAHIAWAIPPLDKYRTEVHDEVTIVDFGYGTNMGTAGKWVEKAVRAFGALLDYFDGIPPIQVRTRAFTRAVNPIHKRCREQVQGNAIVQLEYQDEQLFLRGWKPDIRRTIPARINLTVRPFTLHFQSGFLLDAASIFQRESWLTLRAQADMRMLAVGEVGDRLAVIMGISDDEGNNHAAEG